MIAAFGRFTGVARGTRRLGSAALDLAYVAAGRLDVYYEQCLKPWDMAAGMVLAAEAGAVVSRYDGSPAIAEKGEVMACAPALAMEVRGSSRSPAHGRGSPERRSAARGGYFL